MSRTLDGLSVGGNVKIIRRKVGTYARSWGFGIDVAGKYTLGNFVFGVVGRDITTTLNAWAFNVADLQEQLNKAHKRIAELLEPSIDTLEEQLVRKVMVSRGLDPSNVEDIKEYWKDYHGIED